MLVHSLRKEPQRVDLVLFKFEPGHLEFERWQSLRGAHDKMRPHLINLRVGLELLFKHVLNSLDIMICRLFDVLHPLGLRQKWMGWLSMASCYNHIPCKRY